jgi:hypothetical protein
MSIKNQKMKPIDELSLTERFELVLKFLNSYPFDSSPEIYTKSFSNDDKLRVYALFTLTGKIVDTNSLGLK